MTTAAARPFLRVLPGNAIWIAFVAVQACDGLFTYVGMQWLGVEAEANPVIAWYATTYGIGTSVLGAKLFATACGAILHISGHHRTLAALTFAYALVAIWPWTIVLWG